MLVYGEQATGPSSGQQSSGSGSSGVLVLFHREIPLGQCGVLDHPKDDTAFQVGGARHYCLHSHKPYAAQQSPFEHKRQSSSPSDRTAAPLCVRRCCRLARPSW